MFSIVIICKDEERVIKRCIEYIQQDIEENDEIIVIDTGSRDNTIDIVSRMRNVKLFHFKWNDNFADARNFGISKAKKDWIFFIDADEILTRGSLLELKKSIEEAIKSSSKTEKLTFSPKAVNLDDSTFYNAGRIFANDNSIEYEGCIHEYPVTLDKDLNLVTLRVPKVVVKHDGYEKEVQESKNKTIRNTNLIKKELAINPNNPQYYYYYYRDAKPLLTHQEYEQGMLDFFGKFPDSPYMDQVIKDLAYHYIQNNKNDLAEKYIEMLFDSAKNGIKENHHIAILFTAMNEIQRIKIQQNDLLKLLVYTQENFLHQEETYFDKGYIFDELIGTLFFHLEEYQTAYKISRELENNGYSSHLCEMIDKTTFFNYQYNK